MPVTTACPRSRTLLVSLALSFAIAPLGAVVAAERPVVAVVACDSYADVKKQLGWVGTRVGNPQLPALAESFVMMATQFKGLEGLDVGRPVGIVVTADGEKPVVHGYVPVKDLDKLLATLQGVVGPAEQADGKRRVQVPGGPPLEIEERDGWAVVAMQGSPAGPADAEKLLGQVAEAFSIGVTLLPAAIPPGMRQQLKGVLEQAAEAAAAQGQPIDAAAMNAALDGMAQTESLVFGLAVDMANERMLVETRSVMVPDSAAATVWASAGEAANALGLPAAADGKPTTIRAHHAQAVPPEARPAIEATLAQALAANEGDPVTAALFGLVQDLVGGMLDAGGLEAGLAVDTSGVEEGTLVPAVTLAARVKDGPALEKRVKARFTTKDSLPPATTIAFDAGRAAGANVHEIKVDLAGSPAADQFGDSLTAKLAVTADRAYLLFGGDLDTRLAAAVAAGKAADPKSKPFAGIDLSLPGMMAFAATLAKASGDTATGEVLGEVAGEAAGKPGAVVQMLMRPIERGVAMRLSAGAGAIETIAAVITRQAGGGGPAASGLPIPLDGGVPALA
ncbi:MAG: hypothetical protein FJ284_14870, partial [Planctomycetes bacterium]|nr:hypothetical protein [Planctomycetota bacterium]